MGKPSSEVQAPLVARKTRVFISYSRVDAEFVGRLKEALQAKGYDAFVDTESISGGEKWKRRLDQLIRNADAMAFVVSPDSVSSPVCHWETQRAVTLGKRLLPLLWRPLEGRDLPTQLAERNYVPFDNAERFDASLQALCDAIDVDIEWVREHTRLVDLVTRWDADGRRQDALLRGAELAAAKAWSTRRTPRAPEIPAVFHEFITAAERYERGATGVRRWGQTAQFGCGTIAVIAMAFVGVTIISIAVFPPDDIDYVPPPSYDMAREPVTAREPNVVDTLGGPADAQAIERFSGDIEVVGLDPRWAAQISDGQAIVQYGEFDPHTLERPRRSFFARGMTVWDSHEAGTIIIREGRCQLLNGVEGDFEALFVRQGTTTPGCAKRGLSAQWPLAQQGSSRWQLPALDEHSDFQ